MSDDLLNAPDYQEITPGARGCVYKMPWHVRPEEPIIERPALNAFRCILRDNYYELPAEVQEQYDAAVGAHARTVKATREWALDNIERWHAGLAMVSRRGDVPDWTKETVTQRVLRALLAAGPDGLTSNEAGIQLRIHGGSPASALSALHDAGVIMRMRERR